MLFRSFRVRSFTILRGDDGDDIVPVILCGGALELACDFNGVLGKYVGMMQRQTPETDSLYEYLEASWVPPEEYKEVKTIAFGDD